MGLQEAFDNGVNAIFNVLNEAVKSAHYVVVTDNGLDDATEVRYPVRTILDKFSQKDMKELTFTKLIQPTDTKGLIPGKDLVIAMNTVNILDVEGRRFNIVAYETDPFNALYTLLLRDIR